MRTLGPKAVAPLAKYFDLEPKNGFTQLFAVKFLTAIGGSSPLGPLKKAFAQQDQWEVTRAPALSGIFAVSQAEAKPYVEAALGDTSQLVGPKSCWLCIKSKRNDRPVPGAPPLVFFDGGASGTGINLGPLAVHTRCVAGDLRAGWTTVLTA